MTTAAECPIRPLDDRVVIVRDEPAEIHASGLVLPNADAELTGTVVAVGPGRWYDAAALVEGGSVMAVTAGRRIAIGVAVGDRVRFEAVGGTAVDIDGDEWLVIPERHLLARIE